MVVSPVEYIRVANIYLRLWLIFALLSLEELNALVLMTSTGAFRFPLMVSVFCVLYFFACPQVAEVFSQVSSVHR